ncbi:hypothetical protein H920_18331 [Fukomys damarensis]|uniref:Uncharacterized protein n=1 Tax=Fukomys damarensis TaxID=885580 RepID=A0A091CMX1_FUKDA|nr:hypothetical protein H920_18331 [Fukomys damarensis]
MPSAACATIATPAPASKDSEFRQSSWLGLQVSLSRLRPIPWVLVAETSRLAPLMLLQCQTGDIASLTPGEFRESLSFELLIFLLQPVSCLHGRLGMDSSVGTITAAPMPGQ